ncbi:MAG: DNA mismatch repair protein MutS [Candidatus Hydrogenedentota bacterium]
MARTWKKLSDINTAKLTPMLRQYLEAKAESGESLLFFRMGDFYELFFEDAVEASQLLGITLTSRDGSDKEDPVPMAGVPVRSVETYISRALKAGRTVTICEQMEDPKDAKGVVKRAVSRTITPGTIMEPNLLEERTNNYLAAVSVRGDRAGMAFLDVTTGEFLAAEVQTDAERTIADELTRMAPVEVLFAGGLVGDSGDRIRKRFHGVSFTERMDDEFDPAYGMDTLLDQFGLATLKGLGLDDASEALGCAGAVLHYVKSTQRDAVPHLRPPRRYHPGHFVVIDGNTQRNLELVESLADKKRHGTLLSVIDRTLTSMGGRKIRQWILHPLLDVNEIGRRLDAVEELFNDGERRMRLREALQGVADLERLMGRLTARAGGPRDMKALGTSLDHTPGVKAVLAHAVSPMLADVVGGMDELQDVRSWIANAIVAEPPLSLNDGNIIADGYDAALDELRDLVRGGRDWIAKLQRDESARTGIPNLKVGYNKVFGYFIEVSKGNVHLVPEDYERKQTLVNAERYVTPTLKSREEEIVTAQERMCKLEYDLFVELRDRVSAQAKRIHATADALATVDVLLSLAETASRNQYARPQVHDGDELRIREGRHPVVEDLMSRKDFVPNDTLLESKANLHIVTGPNMAGKSTYLRQVALIALMAQIGSYVPAAGAQVGVVDRIFTRVGASDNLVRGESTFMVEMIETATILNMATRKSLIVLDEIGRGTSTFDGISIAWAVAEHIHDTIGAKTLFATHYHELTDLANRLEHVKNVNVAVREWGGKVVFLYRIVDGGADHSYGIQVAKLAGLPPVVIERARLIMESLEAGNPGMVGLPEQMYLFGPASEPEPSKVEQELDAADLDALSPREALDFLYHLKHMIGKPRKK